MFDHLIYGHLIQMFTPVPEQCAYHSGNDGILARTGPSRARRCQSLESIKGQGSLWLEDKKRSPGYNQGIERPIAHAPCASIERVPCVPATRVYMATLNNWDLDWTSSGPMPADWIRSQGPGQAQGHRLSGLKPETGELNLDTRAVRAMQKGQVSRTENLTTRPVI